MMNVVAVIYMSLVVSTVSLTCAIPKVVAPIVSAKCA
jgi:hypothetical protein